MYELTYSEGAKVLAELKGEKWYEYGKSWELKTDGVIWCEEIK
tara:strand:- start:61 stop:189 length:129 start_codon:yes stop_codon:yes gene_type:complete